VPHPLNLSGESTEDIREFVAGVWIQSFMTDDSAVNKRNIFHIEGGYHTIKKVVASFANTALIP